MNNCVINKMCVYKWNDLENTPENTRMAVEAGDFILVHGNHFWDKLIQFGEGLRFKGNDSKYTYYNHAALIINFSGDLIEADAVGVQQTNLADYKGKDYLIVRITASPEDRSEAVKFAQACIDQRYGWTTILSIGLSLLTGLKFSFGFDGQEICSGLVARALERTTAIFPRDPSHITPADLAKYYEVI